MPSAWSASPQPLRWSSSSSSSSAANFPTTARCSACSSCRASWSSSCSCCSCSPRSRTGTSSSCNCLPRSWRGFRWSSSSVWSSSRRSIGIAQYPPHLAEMVFAQTRHLQPEAAARQIQVARGLCPVLQRLRQGGGSFLCRAVHQLLDEGLLPGMLGLHAAGAGRRGAAGRRLRLRRSRRTMAARATPAPTFGDARVRLAGFSRPAVADRLAGIHPGASRRMLQRAATPSSAACSPPGRAARLARSEASTSAITTRTFRGTS